MRRRSSAGGEPVKTRRRKAAPRKRGSTPKDARPRSSAAAREDKKVALLTRERDEALEQQTATAEILRVISSSPGDLQPVFEAILQNATRICEATYGAMWLREGDGFRNTAFHGALPEAYTGQWRSGMVIPRGPHAILARVARSRKPVHVADLRKDRAYLDGHALTVTAVDVAGIRTAVGVPMLKNNELIGVISIYRQEVHPFTNKQIALVQNFAAQAVIAIENARLLNELRELLQQQTATCGRAKGHQPFDLRPTDRAQHASGIAARLCEADIALIVRPRGSNLEVLANYRMSQASIDVLTSTPIAGGRWTLSGRVLAEGRTVNIPDWRADPGYTFSAVQEISGLQSGLGVPLMREGLPVGVMNLWRTQVRPFTDKQIELVTTFANQAVIAIENARLLVELRESLQQQTATADVLKVISRSTFDLQTVLNTLVEFSSAALRIRFCGVHRPQGASYRYVASFGLPPEFDDYMSEHPIVPERGSVVWACFARAQRGARARCRGGPGIQLVYAARLGGLRTLLGVPLMREGMPIGVLTLGRKKVDPFTDKQIELVKTFADQAVIAIENTRLFEARAAAHARTRRVVGAANGDQRDPARHLEFAERRAAGARFSRRARFTHLRRPNFRNRPRRK